jgi:hypothetical protein
MTPLYTIARDIDQALGGTACADALEASTFDQSLVRWRFLAAVMREMQCAPAKVQAVIDPVIAGMDRLARGEDWPEADARAAAKAAWAAWAARDAAGAGAKSAAEAALAAAEAALAAAKAADAAWDAAAAEADAAWAAWAAELAVRAGVPRARQRDIFLRLIQEASQ